MTNYDRATKFEHVSTAKPEIKRRSLFQIRHEVLASVYHQFEVVDLVLQNKPVISLDLDNWHARLL